jgi:DNA-binding transcriptional LysR family regulator
MDASDLRIFEAVAEAGGMSRAADRLNTVQSNVTARLRALEDELGTALFYRHSRGVALTPAGQRLLPYATRMRTLLVEARRAVADDGRPAGPLVVGSLETTAALRLAPILAGFATAHPAVDLSLITGTTAELVEGVLERRLEAAFVCGPVEHPELVEETLFHEDLVLATTPGIGAVDALSVLPELKIVVLRAGCSYRQRLEEILARRGIVGLRRLEYGTIDGLVACVGAGLGVTLLPRGIVEPAHRAGRIAIHDLPAAEGRVTTVGVRRRDGQVTSALAAFLNAARSPRSTGRREAAD